MLKEYKNCQRKFNSNNTINSNRIKEIKLNENVFNVYVIKMDKCTTQWHYVWLCCEFKDFWYNQFEMPAIYQTENQNFYWINSHDTIKKRWKKS